MTHSGRTDDDRDAGAISVPPSIEAEAEEGHDEAVAQPHDTPTESGPIAEAEARAEAISTEDQPRGRLGPRFDWRSPFFVGVAATLGVAVSYFGISLLAKGAHVFVLIGLALFLAIGMEPAVSFLVRRRFPRVLAVIVVLVVIVAVIAGFLAAAVPAIVSEATALAHNAPKLLQEAKDQNSLIGKLNAKFQIEQHLSSLLSNSSSGVAGGLLAGVATVFGVVADGLIVAVLTVYFLADMSRVRALMYRLFPARRRPRAILIGDEIMAKVGAYVLGNLLVSLIAGVLTYVWLLIFNVPYALLLSIMVAILDLVPVVGSTIAGIIVALVALSVSLPIAIATVGFFIAYRLAEDYLLVPRVIGRAVEVPALVTVVAVLVGGAVLGIIGALVAIPVSAGLLLLAREILFPRLDAA
jgi:predicted PurR-regulated permease PerM